MNTLYQTSDVNSDNVIIHRIIEGEKKLFAKLVSKYNPLLYKIARSYNNSHEDAEDIMQETHFAAYLQLKNFRGDASYKTWLTKIMINRCYHNLQYRQRKLQEMHLDLPEAQVNEIPAKHDGEKAVTNIELGKVLEQSLQELPLIHRTVFVLRAVEGFSVSETAEILEITPVNVKVRLNRAKLILRKQLQSFYSLSDIFEFNAKYCHPLTERVIVRVLGNISRG